MKQILEFLSELKENNNREWFAANKARYQNAHSEFEGMVGKLINCISLFDSTIVNLEPKDCMFRIYKDVRFSKNKDPYKINMGAYICRGGGRKSKYSGYYVHIQPGESFVSGGLYMPEPAIISRVREDFDQYYTDFKQIIDEPTLKKYFKELYGDKLKNVPRGYDKENPAAEILKHKDIFLMHSITDEQLCEDNFYDYASNAYKAIKPFNDFINRAIEDM